jgi:hypothetical protein
MPELADLPQRQLDVNETIRLGQRLVGMPLDFDFVDLHFHRDSWYPDLEDPLRADGATITAWYQEEDGRGFVRVPYEFRVDATTGFVIVVEAPEDNLRESMR